MEYATIKCEGCRSLFVPHTYLRKEPKEYLDYDPTTGIGHPARSRSLAGPNSMMTALIWSCDKCGTERQFGSER